jgi:hypothetical protein
VSTVSEGTALLSAPPPGSGADSLDRRKPVPRRRLAPAATAAAAVTAALVLSACSQPSTALDNPETRQDSRTITPPTVLRTPLRVPSAPATVQPPEGQQEQTAELGERSEGAS